MNMQLRVDTRPTPNSTDSKPRAASMVFKSPLSMHIFWDKMLRGVLKSELTFQRKMSPPSSEFKSKPNKKQ
jgi:hypothetical protein